MTEHRPNLKFVTPFREESFAVKKKNKKQKERKKNRKKETEGRVNMPQISLSLCHCLTVDNRNNAHKWILELGLRDVWLCVISLRLFSSLTQQINGMNKGRQWKLQSVVEYLASTAHARLVLIIPRDQFKLAVSPCRVDMDGIGFCIHFTYTYNWPFYQNVMIFWFWQLKGTNCPGDHILWPALYE